MVYINLWLHLIIPLNVSTKYNLGFRVLCNNIPGSHAQSLRYRTFKMFGISGKFLTILS